MSTSMDDLYNSNRFISDLIELQDILEEYNLFAYTDYIQPKKKKYFWQKEEKPAENKFKQLTDEKTAWFIRRNFGIDRAGEDADYNRGYTLTFQQLWDFCQFVRYAEKVLFYENNMEENKLFVSSTLTDISSRKFIIKHGNVDIIITLEKENTRDDILKIVKLEIIRNYGKMMKNEYVIVNEMTDRLDISDNILIMNVNRIIYKYVLNTYLDIIEKFLKGIKESVRWKTEDWEIYKLQIERETLSGYV